MLRYENAYSFKLYESHCAKLTNLTIKILKMSFHFEKKLQHVHEFVVKMLQYQNHAIEISKLILQNEHAQWQFFLLT